MKYSGQDIPPELAGLYADLISPTNAGAGADGTARTRRRVKLANRQKKIDRKALAIAVVVMALAVKYRKATGSSLHSAWRSARARELASGIINPEFWQPATKILTDSLASTPSNTTYTGSRRYNYPDDANRPTTPHYPDGVASAGNPLYTGATAAGFFKDTLWRWRRSIWRMAFPIGSKHGACFFVALDGSIKIDTSNRASRPMLSLRVRLRAAAASATLTADASPPAANVSSLYWRFVIPRSAAPYYHANIQRHELLTASKGVALGAGEYLSVTEAPHPMNGTGYNNNTSVSTEWQGSAVVYENDPCGTVEGAMIWVNSNNITMAYDPEADQWEEFGVNFGNHDARCSKRTILNDVPFGTLALLDRHGNKVQDLPPAPDGKPWVHWVGIAKGGFSIASYDLATRYTWYICDEVGNITLDPQWHGPVMLRLYRRFARVRITDGDIVPALGESTLDGVDGLIWGNEENLFNWRTADRLRCFTWAANSLGVMVTHVDGIYFYDHPPRAKPNINRTINSGRVVMVMAGNYNVCAVGATSTGFIISNNGNVYSVGPSLVPVPVSGSGGLLKKCYGRLCSKLDQ